MRQQEIAVLANELLHPLVGRGIVVERLHLLLLPLGRVAHQYVGGLPRGFFIFPADHPRPDARRSASRTFPRLRASRRRDRISETAAAAAAAGYARLTACEIYPGNSPGRGRATRP